MELRFSTLAKLITRSLDEKGVFLIGVDGCGGSGKSLFAETLVTYCQSSTIIEMDDFYHTSEVRDSLPDNEEYGTLFDWQRLRSDVLEPLSQGHPAHYLKYDWDEDEMGEQVSLQPRGLIVIEGVYSTRAAIRHYFDWCVWVDCPYELRLQRGLERDGDDEEVRSNWIDLWMPKEQEYVQTENPALFADIRVDGVMAYGVQGDESIKLTSDVSGAVAVDGI